MKYLFTWAVLILTLHAAAQQQHIYNSNNLSKPDTTIVFRPSGAPADAKLPLIFLLHGYSGNYNQWNSIMNAQKYADTYGFIIVCPDGLYNSWYLDSPVKKGAGYASFFFEELWPDIIKKYHPAMDKIFISGLSMGGHGALTLFLKHPELFRSAGSTSGVTDLDGLTSKYELAELLGAHTGGPGEWAKFSAIGNIEKLKGSSKTIIFDCGADDPFYAMNNALKAKCDALKINATYISQPGNHNRAYWAKSIRQHFDFFKAQLE